ncbi:MAG TPA: rRNA maturation RNase YbeY [Anaeromyxobacteraceae bacterium]
MVRVRCEHARGGAAARRLRRSATRFLAALGMPGAELSVLIAGDPAIRRLNRTWRGVDAATDVLSFPAPPAPGSRLLGDVALSLDTAARRARAERRAVGDELDRYLAHGLLHLLGHDHAGAREARAMARFEAALLGGEGLVAEARDRRRPVARR